MEDLTFLSSDESVVAIEDGCLTPMGVGAAIVTARCLGLRDYSFSVSITNDECTYIRLPQSIVSIASESFYGDSGISHVILPDGITTIGSGAFDSCENLKTILLPASVTTIEENAFSNAVVLCCEGNAANEFAVSEEIPYILIQQ